MAGASGFEKAATILSDYYIKRAEQYQPVIDVPTGVEVEIVFQEGVDLNLKNNDIIGASGVIKNSNQSINDIVVDNNKVGGF
jgi:hypothetical protein